MNALQIEMQSLNFAIINIYRAFAFLICVGPLLMLPIITCSCLSLGAQGEIRNENKAFLFAKKYSNFL